MFHRSLEGADIFHQYGAQWRQNHQGAGIAQLGFRTHIHCVVPGGVSLDSQRWTFNIKKTIAVKFSHFI